MLRFPDRTLAETTSVSLALMLRARKSYVAQRARKQKRSESR